MRTAKSNEPVIKHVVKHLVEVLVLIDNNVKAQQHNHRRDTHLHHRNAKAAETVRVDWCDKLGTERGAVDCDAQLVRRVERVHRH
jgi:hypothetical protein